MKKMSAELVLRFKNICSNFERESSLKSTIASWSVLMQYESTCDRRFQRLWRRNCAKNFWDGAL